MRRHERNKRDGGVVVCVTEGVGEFFGALTAGAAVLAEETGDHLKKGTNQFLAKKIPNEKYTFFQNYADHWRQLDYKAGQVMTSMRKKGDESGMQLLGKAAIERLYVFDALKDKYDYADELFDVLFVPFASIGIILVSAAVVTWQVGLGISALFSDDEKDHWEVAVNTVLFAGAALLLAFVTMLKAAPSLILRPLMTLGGYKEQVDLRFYDYEKHQEAGYQGALTTQLGDLICQYSLPS